MLQVFQNPKSGETRLEDVPTPALKPGGILVRNKFSVVSSGTEKNIIELSKKNILQKAKERPDYVRKFFMLVKTKGLKWAWGVAQSKLSTDIALGYSSAGEVVAVGAQAEGFLPGDRVACAGQDYASHAEYVYVPKNLAVKVPEGVAEDEAAFATMGAIAMQGIRRANLTPGEKVAVIGLGLLGQIATRLLRAYGHPVIGFDVNPAQIDFAKQAGMEAGALASGEAKFATESFTDGRGVDAVIIYASAKTDEPLKLAGEIVRDRGRVVQVGNVIPNIPWRDFVAKELSFFASRSYGPGRYDETYEEGGVDYPIGQVRWTERRNMEEFLRLLATGRLSVKDLITKTFDIKDAKEAYQEVFNPATLLHAIELSYPEDENKSISKMEFERREVVTAGKGSDDVFIGLIGLGSFMKAEILPHLKQVKGVNVHAVAHSHGKDAKKVAEEWNASYATSNYRELLEDKDIDLIIIATRHSSHARMTIEALKAGKHVYVEKPIALTEDELNEVMLTAKDAPGLLFTGFNRRFSKHLVKAREEFSASRTPLQILYRINYALDEHWSQKPEEGGRLIGEGCHFADALSYVIGSRPKRISASMVPKGGAVPHEENFSFTIQYENGSVGTVFYSGLGNYRLPKEYIEVYGDGNVMTIDNFQKAKLIKPEKVRKLDLPKQHKGYLEELEALVGAIREGGSSPIPYEELFLSHLAIIKASEAVKTGESIKLEYE